MSWLQLVSVWICTKKDGVFESAWFKSIRVRAILFTKERNNLFDKTTKN